MAYAQSNGYTDISGGFNPQNNLQSIMALLQGGARPEGVSAEVPSSLRPIEPYSTPKPLTSARGVEMAMPPEQMPFMAAPYSAPSAERTGQVSQTSLGAKPGLQSMMSASDMGVLGGGGPMSSNSRSFTPQNYGGGVQSLPMNAAPKQPAATASLATGPTFQQAHLSPFMKNYNEGMASQAKMFAKREQMRVKGLKRMGY